MLKAGKMVTAGQVMKHFSKLGVLPLQVIVTDAEGKEMPLEEGFSRFIELARSCRQFGRKMMFVGNGGSASIASHMAIDWSKNGGVPALAFNDAPSLTCLANDLGFSGVFAHHVTMLGCAGDLLVAISSSGNSENILDAVAAAGSAGVTAVTFSGFAPLNKLRALGAVNFYVPAMDYGSVEVTHLALLHAMLDMHREEK